jgi:hypothetical protein
VILTPQFCRPWSQWTLKGTWNDDRDKLRAAIRKLGKPSVFCMLADAIGLLPPAKLLEIAKKYLDIKRLRPDAEHATGSRLLAEAEGGETRQRRETTRPG